MEDICCSLKVGQSVPDFELDTFDPKGRCFGKISLEKLKQAGKWTVMFFYPADFTFV
jgi:peroxiredoxin (alkyl hydroperoxide reductase subunit C)